MLPIIGNSNEGQDHKYKYFDTSKTDRVTRNNNRQSGCILSLRSYDQWQFLLKIGQMSRSKNLVPTK